MERATSAAAVTVGAKRTVEYVFEAAARLNREPSVTLRGIGQSMAKAAEAARILCERFPVKIESTAIHTLQLDRTRFTALDIAVRLHANSAHSQESQQHSAEFVPFPIYHLLFNSILDDGGKIPVRIHDEFHLRSEHGDGGQIEILQVEAAEFGFRCLPGDDLRNSATQGPEHSRVRSILLANLAAAFSRSGLLLSRYWEAVSRRLGEFDDVILGLDTNILRNCVMTQQLLDGFVMTSHTDHIHTPNWILLIIPNAVMHEIEQVANSRDRGRLDREGRLGYRALAEILELHQSIDMRGVALLIVGEADPIMDARVEIRGLREDFKSTAEQTVRARLFRRLSAGDTIIRDQFKNFLRQLSFHKGVFFLTADKSNSALAQAEGLHAIYYPPPITSCGLYEDIPVDPHFIPYQPEPVYVTVPLGKLLYELCVQFGTISVQCRDRWVQLRCDLRGESLLRWVNRDIMIGQEDVARMVEQYYASPGRISLEGALLAWNDLNADFMAVEEGLPELDA